MLNSLSCYLPVTATTTHHHLPSICAEKKSLILGGYLMIILRTVVSVHPGNEGYLFSIVVDVMLWYSLHLPMVRFMGCSILVVWRRLCLVSFPLCLRSCVLMFLGLQSLFMLSCWKRFWKIIYIHKNLPKFHLINSLPIQTISLQMPTRPSKRGWLCSSYYFDHILVDSLMKLWVTLVFSPILYGVTL